MDEDRPGDAVAILEEYLAIYPNDTEAHKAVGFAHFAAGSTWKAERHLRRTLAAVSDQRDAQMLLLRLLMDRHLWEEAFDLATDLRRSHPSDNMVRILWESCAENVDRPEVGWERDADGPPVNIEFTRDT
jgi:hypothetical protein